MNYKILTIISVLLYVTACGPSAEEDLKLIKETESELYDASKEFNVAKADMLIRNYDQFATKHPKHEKAASFLFRAGDLSMGRNKSDLAIGFFDRVINDYPDFEKSPDALFLKGFVLENQVKDLDQAETVYNEFLSKYPDHDMASSAEFSLKNLGIPPDQLIKSFEQNAMKDSSVVDSNQVQ